MKKLEYIIPSFLTSNVKENYPKYVDMIVEFAKYLDIYTQGRILNIDDNLTTSDIFDELIDLYLENALPLFFDLDVYDLTNNNKKTFIGLGHKINGLKGHKEAFSIFFQTLSDIKLATEGGTVDISDVGNVIFDEPTAIDRIFQYRFKINTRSYDDILDLVENVHPAGMIRQVFTTTYDGTYNYDGTILYDGQEV